MELNGDQYLALARPRVFEKQEVETDGSELSRRLFAANEVYLNAISLYQMQIRDLNTKMGEQAIKTRTLAVNSMNALDRFENEAKTWEDKAHLLEQAIDDLKLVQKKLQMAYTKLSEKNAQYKAMYDAIRNAPRRRIMSTGQDVPYQTFTDYMRVSDVLYILETGREGPHCHN